MPKTNTCLTRSNSELRDEEPMRVHVYFHLSSRVILIVSISHFSDFLKVLSMFHYYSMNFMVAERSPSTSIFIRKNIWTHVFMQFFQSVVKIYAILNSISHNHKVSNLYIIFCQLNHTLIRSPRKGFMILYIVIARRGAFRTCMTRNHNGNPFSINLKLIFISVIDIAVKCLYP